MESVFVLTESLVGGIRIGSVDSLDTAMRMTKNMNRGRDVTDFKLLFGKNNKVACLIIVGYIVSEQGIDKEVI